MNSCIYTMIEKNPLHFDIAATGELGKFARGLLGRSETQKDQS